MDKPHGSCQNVTLQEQASKKAAAQRAGQESFSRFLINSYLPVIKRARGFRLYSEDRRFLDLYLDGGRAVLGHNPPAALRELKNAAGRSLFAPYPSRYTRRFEKALAALFPGCSFSFHGEKTEPLWRPYMNRAAAADFAALLPHPLAPLVFIRQSGAKTELPPELSPSPVVLAAVTRAIYDYINWPERAQVNFRKIDAALKNGAWTRSGIYFYAKTRVPDSAWEKVFKDFLDDGFLIPPNQNEPFVLPFEMSKGEETKLAEKLNALKF